MPPEHQPAFFSGPTRGDAPVIRPESASARITRKTLDAAKRAYRVDWGKDFLRF